MWVEPSYVCWVTPNFWKGGLIIGAAEKSASKNQTLKQKDKFWFPTNFETKIGFAYDFDSEKIFKYLQEIHFLNRIWEFA